MFNIDFRTGNIITEINKSNNSEGNRYKINGYHDGRIYLYNLTIKSTLSLDVKTLIDTMITSKDWNYTITPESFLEEDLFEV